jgi:hypothetical protein
LVKEVAIFKILQNKQNSFSNGLVKEVTIFPKLPNVPSARAYIRARIPVAIPGARPRFPSRACGEKSSSRSRATDNNLSSRSRADRAPYSIAISCSTPGSIIAHPVHAKSAASSWRRPDPAEDPGRQVLSSAMITSSTLIGGQELGIFF